MPTYQHTTTLSGIGMAIYCKTHCPLPLSLHISTESPDSCGHGEQRSQSITVTFKYLSTTRCRGSLQTAWTLGLGKTRLPPTRSRPRSRGGAMSGSPSPCNHAAVIPCMSSHQKPGCIMSYETGKNPKFSQQAPQESRPTQCNYLSYQGSPCVFIAPSAT